MHQKKNYPVDNIFHIKPRNKQVKNADLLLYISAIMAPTLQRSTIVAYGHCRRSSGDRYHKVTTYINVKKYLKCINFLLAKFFSVIINYSRFSCYKRLSLSLFLFILNYFGLKLDNSQKLMSTKRSPFANSQK